MRETPQLKHIEQVSDGWIKKYILTYVLPDGSDYIYEAASRKGLKAYRAELARLEARSNTAIAAIDEGAEDFGAAAIAAAEQAADTSGKRTADAVSIVPITRDGNLVLIREFRYPLNSWVVGLPAGLVEPGEELAVAVDRELREETGIEADEADFHLVRSFREHSTFSDVYFLFHDIPLSALHLQPGETTEARWVSKAGLEALVASGEVAQPDVRRLRQLRDEFRKIWNA